MSTIVIQGVLIAKIGDNIRAMVIIKILFENLKLLCLIIEVILR
jgi:hypothetical protein